MPTIAGAPGASCRGGARWRSRAVQGPVRLNLFQRMMLRWRALHPYNPVHVLRVPAALERPRLQACIAARLQAAGLGAAPALQTLPAQPTAAQALHTAIEEAFNRPFAADDGPWRFFVVEDGDAFHLGLAYDHYVAGGDAVAELLSDIALAYLGAAGGPLQTRAVHAPTYRSLLLRHPGWVLQALLALPGVAARGRRASRVPRERLADAHNGFACLSLPPAQTQRLLQTTRAWGVTLNDLLLAALLLLLAPHAAARLRHARRRDLAAASIINIRRDLGPPAATWPAPCLAALRVQHAVPDGIGLQQLARELHAQTAAMKRRHLYLQSLVGLSISALAWRWLPPVHRQHWFGKHYPLWAGVTTLNLNPIWAARDGAPAGLDYLRAVPTGPLCPLVLAATTAHDTLRLGIAYRRSAFAPHDVQALADGLAHRLEQAAQEADR